jgi:hypothetical protein
LPSRVDPKGGFDISTINGSTPSSGQAEGFTNGTNLTLIGNLNAYIQSTTGGTPPGGFNTTTGGGNVVNIQTFGNTEWIYSNNTTGSNGANGEIFVQDPVAGTAISQIVSFSGQTP